LAYDKSLFDSLFQRRDLENNIISYNYCSYCADRYLSRCSCGELKHKDSRDCAVCKAEYTGLNDYNYKPIKQRYHIAALELKQKKSKPLFFGFELEVESGNSRLENREVMAHLVKEKIGSRYVYCVTDGSLHNGIEIVSYPFTWDWYKKEGGIDKWNKLLLFLKQKEWGADKYPNCGIHIHSTKAVWTSFQIYKLVQFIYNPINRSFIYDVAGREPNRYCQITETDTMSAVKIAKDKKNVNASHYNLLNLNNKAGSNGHTIEFRMFKSTLEPLYFHSNIEFVQAIYNFTRDNAKKHMTDKHFLSYINGFKGQYPALIENLTMKLKRIS
jgi:hypothetical protein